MSRAVKWTGWITLAGIVALAALLIGRIDRRVDSGTAGGAHEATQDGRLAAAERWQSEHTLLTKPMIVRFERVERKVDLLTLWLRMVGRAEGWPEFPDLAKIPKQTDPGPGLYAAEQAPRSGCP